MIYKKEIEENIKEWLKNNVRYRVGGTEYLKRLATIEYLCALRAKWLMESMDFYAESIERELGERK